MAIGDHRYDHHKTVYRTGDIVRFLPDGNVDFVGRNDFQIKIRGFRVELTEIEARIRLFPNIKDATVVSADAPSGGKCAVAYVVSNEKIVVEDINSFIEAELPAYMVPAAIMQIESVPLNPNGKVDRKKLPTPVYSTTTEKSDSQNQTNSPLNDLELEIHKIVANILGHKDFGITTNLLRAGLASISCIKLSVLIQEKLDVTISARDIMKKPTILDIENIIIQQFRNVSVISDHQRSGDL